MSHSRKPAELASEMTALQERIDRFNNDVEQEMKELNIERDELLAKGQELGFSFRHMQGWLAKVPKVEAT